MESYSIILIILAITIGLSAFAEKRRLPSSIVLILGGIVMGFSPSMSEIKLDPEIVFLIFLPPLLYDAAFNISFRDFKTNFSTISTLATGLVFLTTIGVAVVSHYIIPGMSWPLAFVLGAILSATDAVAAIGITKGLGLSHKTLTILEGESLINDASALVAYKFSVAAVMGATFVWWKAGGEFILLLAGGMVVGAILGRVITFILRWLKGFPVIMNSLMLLMPFVTYRIAEEFHVSGIIAVVVYGLSIAHISRQFFPEALKQQSRSIWEIIIFLLNGFIFILIGLEFPYVLKDMDHAQILPNIGYAGIITIVALAIRTVRIFQQRIRLQRGFDSGKVRISEEALLDFQTSVIISLSGIRGIMSLAIAIGLPVVLPGGEAFPMRSTIIFISVAVVLFTLIGQGLVLPGIVKRVMK